MKTHVIGAIALLVVSAVSAGVGVGIGYLTFDDKIVEYENALLVGSLEDCEELNKDFYEAAALVVGQATKQPAVDIKLSSGKTIRIPALRPPKETGDAE